MYRNESKIRGFKTFDVAFTAFSYPYDIFLFITVFCLMVLSLSAYARSLRNI